MDRNPHVGCVAQPQGPFPLVGIPVVMVILAEQVLYMPTLHTCCHWKFNTGRLIVSMGTKGLLKWVIKRGNIVEAWCILCAWTTVTLLKEKSVQR